MPEFKPPRPGEIAVPLPDHFDASLYFIGKARTPWATPSQCPKSSRGRVDIVATLEIDPRFALGLKDIELYSHIIVLYWLHYARRDLIAQVPSHLTSPRGTFALRSPVRPNPIGLAVCELIEASGASLKVRNLDCCDATPVIDIKPYYAGLDSEPEARRPS